MTKKPQSKFLSHATTEVLFQRVQLIATDMDGTLTWQGRFTSELVAVLEDLQAAGIDVLIITGRSAGWVESLNNYLPVACAIAENGGLFYSNLDEDMELLTPLEDIVSHRQHLAQSFRYLQTHFPWLRESRDNRFRLTDWTFDIGSLTTVELSRIASLLAEQGWGFTYSTVQCHIKPLRQDKARGLQQVLQRYFPQLTPQNLVTVGDSPNDESLFNPRQFPLSVGVANVEDYRGKLVYQPAYVTTKAESQGFCELARSLLLQRGSV